MRKRRAIRLGELWSREIDEDTVVVQFGLAGRKPRDVRGRDVSSGGAEINRGLRAPRRQENKRASPSD